VARKKISLSANARRAVLTDMLPFEVPPTFSNRGFYRFLERFEVEISGGRVQWTCSDSFIDPLMRLLIGAESGAQIESIKLSKWGGTKDRRSISVTNCLFDTIPLQFRVAHSQESRVLSIPHPRNQIQVAGFYASDGPLILYYSSLSQFSIRRPISVAKFANFDDKLHQQTLDQTPGVEEEDKEYAQLGSYFVYRRFRNIHGFFESPDYHRCEKKYDAMVQLDVSRCFDSIYTHSIAWAILGKPQTKLHLKESLSTFAGRFDSLMQSLNYKETNGILIGPEFSRVFAEIILQSVDTEIESALHSQGIVHGRDYEAFRYVDDYFVFGSDKSLVEKISEQLNVSLRAKKLSINASKIKSYTRPIITELTIAKDRVGAVFSQAIAPIAESDLNAAPEVPPKFICPIRLDRLIVRYKTLVKESEVEYSSILNYTLAILENKLDAILKTFGKTAGTTSDQERLIRAVLSLLEFAFFAFAASPKVNHAVRLARMIAVAVDYLRSSRIPYDLKHQVFRAVYDGIVEHLQKSPVTEHREVEGLYLLVALVHIGKEYWLPEAVLAKYFQIHEVEGKYQRKKHLGYFAITALLSYMRDKHRYTKLRAFVTSHAIEKVKSLSSLCPQDAETLMLFLDLLTCPFFAAAEKQQLASFFKVSPTDLNSIVQASSQWFTAWGRSFSLTRDLAAKRSREVY
jgi:hypothetical protein